MKIKTPNYYEGAALAVASALVAVCAFSCGLLLHVDSTLSNLDNTLKAVTTEVKNVETTRTKIDTAVDSVTGEVNKLEITRKSVDDLLVQTTVLITDADDATAKESEVFDNINTEMTSTLGHVDASVVAFNKNQDAITAQTVTTIDGINQAFAQMTPLVTNANTTVVALNKIVTDPNIPKSIEQGQKLLVASTGLIQDGKDEADKFVHPEKKKLTFKVGLNATVDWICGHLIPPLF
jgi:septal ring factor EnvC (AmiA/AmiB activator)